MDKARKLNVALNDSAAWTELNQRKAGSESKVRGWFSRLITRYLNDARRCRVDIDIPLVDFASISRLAAESEILSSLRLESDTGRKGARASDPDLVVSLLFERKHKDGSQHQSGRLHENVQLIMKVKRLSGSKVAKGDVDQLIWYFAVAYALYRCRYAVYAAPDRVIIFEREGNVIWMPNMEANRSRSSQPLEGAHQVGDYVYNNSAHYETFTDPEEIDFHPTHGLRSLALLQPMVDLVSALDNIISVEETIRNGISGDEFSAIDQIAGSSWTPLDRWDRTGVDAADAEVKRKRLKEIGNKRSTEQDNEKRDDPERSAGTEDKPPSLGSTGKKNHKRRKPSKKSDGRGSGGGRDVPANKDVQNDSGQVPAMTLTSEIQDASAILNPHGSPEVEAPVDAFPQGPDKPSADDSKALTSATSPQGQVLAPNQAYPETPE